MHEAKTHLSELLSEVAHSRNRIVIERRGKPVAALISIHDFSTLPSVPTGSLMDALRKMEKLPALDDEELDEMVRWIYAERRRGLPEVQSD